MGVYCIVANDASVGTTIGSFDAINTRNADIRLRDGTNHVIGIPYCAVPAAQTTGTATMARLRVQSADLALAAGAADFALAHVAGAGIATQSGGHGVPARWIPFEAKAGAGNVVNLFLSQMGIEPADNISIEAGIAHVAGAGPDGKWMDYAANGNVGPSQGSVSTNGGSTTTARTSLTATTVPSRFTKMIGATWLQAADAVQSTAEPVVAFVEVTSTIGDFDPEEWPTTGVAPALAGTLVGLGVFADQPPLPFYFVKSGASTPNIEPFVTSLGTVTGANAYGFDIRLRY